MYGGIKLYESVSRAKILVKAEFDVNRIRRDWENGNLNFGKLKRVEIGVADLDDFNRKWNETSLKVKAGAAVVEAGWEVNDQVGGGLGKGAGKTSISDFLPDRVRPPYEIPFEKGASHGT